MTLFRMCHDASILCSMKNKEKSTVTRDSDKFMLRLPDGMRNQIMEAAKAGNRSMNAEIVTRLSESLGVTGGPLSGYTDGDLVKELLNRYERGAIYIRIGKQEEAAGRD